MFLSTFRTKREAILSQESWGIEERTHEHMGIGIQTGLINLEKAFHVGRCLIQFCEFYSWLSLSNKLRVCARPRV